MKEIVSATARKIAKFRSPSAAVVEVDGRRVELMKVRFDAKLFMLIADDRVNNRAAVLVRRRLLLVEQLLLAFTRPNAQRKALECASRGGAHCARASANERNGDDDAENDAARECRRRSRACTPRVSVFEVERPESSRILMTPT